MESRRNPRVLPSNAPALPQNSSSQRSTLEFLTDTITEPNIRQRVNDDIQCRSCRLLHDTDECRASVLQVSSGNADLSVFASRTISSKIDLNQTVNIIASPLPTSTSFHSSDTALILEQPSGQRHSGIRKRLPNYWGCEWKTERYRIYREKCRQRAAKGPIVWPDELEEAFQQGLRIYRNQGREKRLLGDKLSGGNEFIAQYIFNCTGQKRDRKKVSSHIQTEKGYMKNNPQWLSLVKDIPPEKGVKKGRRHASSATNTKGRYDNLGVDDSAQYGLTHGAGQSLSTPELTPPGEIMSSIDDPGPTIRRVEFAMSLYEGIEVAPTEYSNTPDDNRSGHRQIYEYTSIQTEIGSASQVLEDLKDWRKLYPQLAAYYDNNEYQGPLFLFDSKLKLLNKYPGVGLRLGTDLSIVFGQGTWYKDWWCLTRLYEQSGMEIDLPRFYESFSLSDSPNSRIRSYDIVGSVDTKLDDIPLTAKWWAAKISEFLSKSQEAERTGNAQVMKEQRDATRKYLRGVSIMQEILATPKEGSQPQRMAILLWRFDLARHAEAATTSWRRVIPPVSSHDIKLPTCELLPSSLNLDAAFGSPMLLQPDLHSTQPNMFTDNTAGILANQISEKRPLLMAASPDYYSLTSSMSTSFPPSTSMTDCTVDISQATSFQTEDPKYPSLDSLHTQSSAYSTAVHAQGSFESQDNNYNSQIAPCKDVESTLYDFSSQQQEAFNTIPFSQDFVGGEIQLSFADQENPLIAPRANMISQHQLEQYLQQFDQHSQLDKGNDSSQEEIRETHAEQTGYGLDMSQIATQFDPWEEHTGIYSEIEPKFDESNADHACQIHSGYPTPETLEEMEE